MLDIISIFVKPFVFFLGIEIVLSIIAGALNGNILEEVIENTTKVLGLFVLVVLFSLFIGSASPLMLVIAFVGTIILLGV